jgi:hypothetical protein
MLVQGWTTTADLSTYYNKLGIAPQVVDREQETRLGMQVSAMEQPQLPPAQTPDQALSNLIAKSHVEHAAFQPGGARNDLHTVRWPPPESAERRVKLWKRLSQRFTSLVEALPTCGKSTTQKEPDFGRGLYRRVSYLIQWPGIGLSVTCGKPAWPLFCQLGMC